MWRLLGWGSATTCRPNTWEELGLRAHPQGSLLVPLGWAEFALVPRAELERSYNLDRPLCADPQNMGRVGALGDTWEAEAGGSPRSSRPA